MENVCRICLEEDKFLIDLKTCRYETQLSYYELFVECTGIALDETENSLICRSCKDLLSSAYELRVRAKKSTDYLRSKVNEIVEFKCEAVLIEIKQEVEDVKIKEEEPETDDQKMDNVAETVDNPKVDRPKVRRTRKKAKKVAQNLKCSWKYRCRYCLALMKAFTLKLKCERLHIKRNNGVECHHCGRRYPTRPSLLNHLYSHFVDPNRFKCPDCPATYNLYSSFDSHRRYGHPKDGIYFRNCQICGREFRSRSNLKEHEARHHGMYQGQFRKYICDICGKQFFYIGDIKIHIERVHLNLYQFKCKQCPRAFKEIGILNAHIDSEHQDETNKKMFICDVCGKELTSKCGLKLHQSTHTSEYKFKCTFDGCKSVFKHKVSLRSHQRTHGPIESHQCDFCPKTFRNKTSLRNHRYLHMPEKMHKCEFCEKSFNLPCYLKEHEKRVHLGVRFDCPTCGASFSTKRNMGRHMKQNCTQGINVSVDPNAVRHINVDSHAEQILFE